MNKTREKCAWQILVKYYIILTARTKLLGVSN